MPRGEKFNAAEKHFLEKEIKYQKQIARQQEIIVQLKSDQIASKTEKQKMQDENTQLKDWIERLLQYTELSQNDIRAVCEQDKRHGEAIASFTKLFGLV